MTDLATHLAQLETHLARFRDKGILNLIDGQDVAGASTFETRSPTDDSLICTVARGTAADIDAAARAGIGDVQAPCRHRQARLPHDDIAGKHGAIRAVLHFDAVCLNIHG